MAETDVLHSGIYQCEPGAAPTAKVNVHVLDGEFLIDVADVVDVVGVANIVDVVGVALNNF